MSNSPNEQSNHDFDRYSRDQTVTIYILDAPLTVNEIKKTISSLKRNKSGDYENNVADFFIDANDFISPFLCVIFNKYLNWEFTLRLGGKVLLSLSIRKVNHKILSTIEGLP